MAKNERQRPRHCRKCRGTGVDPDTNHRYTCGGHDDRDCPLCDGAGVVEDDTEQGTKEEEDAAT